MYNSIGQFGWLAAEHLCGIDYIRRDKPYSCEFKKMKTQEKHAG